MEQKTYRPRNDYRGNKPKNGHDKQKQSIPVPTNFLNPYAFVPFCEKVFCLNESETVELDYVQDIPVLGGMSGTIHVDFKAESPFCVRGMNENNAKLGDRYFVPGSSIKGMIRGVLEIISLGNARNGIANNRYSMRDLYSPDYELKGNGANQKGGFLLKLQGKYYIMPCLSSEQMTYKAIAKEEEDSNLEDTLKKAKSVADKYKLIQDRVVYYGDKPYMWFFSGAMQNKKHEYLLGIPEINEGNWHAISSTVWEDFIFIHEKENENKSWAYWKKKLINHKSVDEIADKEYEGIVPCFFRLNADNTIKDLGFSYLYRQPYGKRLHDFLPEAHAESAIDLAQAIFGYVSKDDALKGRVHFSNCFIDGVEPMRKQTFILGSPKPSFYPFYIQQKAGEKKQNTYFSDAPLAGNKRYLIHERAQVGNTPPSKVTTSFYPLPSGTRFSCEITFHNLHDYEVGALLAALEFCGEQGCYHSLGFAKPYGYGKIKVENCMVDIDPSAMKETLVKAFVEKITQRCEMTEEEWRSYLKPLFVCSRENFEKEIRYPHMQNKDLGLQDEFKGIKNDKKSLSDFAPKM